MKNSLAEYLLLSCVLTKTLRSAANLMHLGLMISEGVWRTWNFSVIVMAINVLLAVMECWCFTAGDFATQPEC